MINPSGLSSLTTSPVSVTHDVVCNHQKPYPHEMPEDGVVGANHADRGRNQDLRALQRRRVEHSPFVMRARHETFVREKPGQILRDHRRLGRLARLRSRDASDVIARFKRHAVVLRAVNGSLTQLDPCPGRARTRSFSA